jgi:hypothetical protein
MRLQGAKIAFPLFITPVMIYLHPCHSAALNDPKIDAELS